MQNAQNQTLQPISDALKNIPNNPGVYQYFDEFQNLLYVGKAKNLKKRVKSYFVRNANHSQRIKIMVSKIAFAKFTITQSEQDALILENSFIKSMKPKYNILLRDDKTYPYIFAPLSDDFPTLDITRNLLKKRDIAYFGPFSTGAKELLDSVVELTKLVPKKSCLKGKKHCLFHQINRCYAPCEGKISKDDYAQILKNALDLLNNKKKLLKLLEQKMLECAQNQAFEQAAILRDRIQKIAKQTQSAVDLADGSNLDVFAFSNSENLGVMMKLFVRGGRIISSDFTKINLQNFENLESLDSQSLQDIYTQAILSHYRQHTPLLPESILLPLFEFSHLQQLQDVLQNRLSKKISILQPQRGKRVDLVDLALQNARQILKSKDSQGDEFLQDLARFFGLSETPYRVEIFDTSHHAGAQRVGGMVVFENGEFDKDSYRKFNLQGADEYAQMSELLSRRALKFAQSAPPNLWLLDGGKAQVKIAREVLESTGVQVDVMGISKHKSDGRTIRTKGRASDILHFYKNGELVELKLPDSDKRLQFFQKLRDEAHRFAITFHRAQKTRQLGELKILENTYTKAQAQKLLRIYGSLEVIQNLDSEEIAKSLKSRV